MSETTTVACNGHCRPKTSREKDVSILNLSNCGSAPNVRVRFEKVSHKLVREIPEILLDLLDIAAFVYCADRDISRGTRKARDNGINWSRTFDFWIPVRVPACWKNKEIKEALNDVLQFLTEDRFEFHFRKAEQPLAVEQYFQFSEADFGTPFQEVSLFSGGADSLAWALHRSVVDKANMVLVSHKAAPIVAKRQNDLIDAIHKCTDSRVNPFHIQVDVHGSGSDAIEVSQRSRSFMFASLAMTVSSMVGLSRFTIPENGITSINLPYTRAVVGARATRSTNPRTILLLEKLLSLIVERSIHIDNPLLFRTKAGVLDQIRKSGFPQLLVGTSSCAQTRGQTKQYTHCGICSQCIERRFAAIATEMTEYDDPVRYEIDILTQGIPDGNRMFAVEYIQFMREVSRMSDLEFEERFANILYWMLDGQPHDSEISIESVRNLYTQHANTVLHALEKSITSRAPVLALQGAHPDSLLAITFGTNLKIVKPAVFVSPSGNFVRTKDGEYTFQGNQAEIVKQLVELKIAGRTPVHESEVLEGVKENVSSKRLHDVFRHSPAWKTLIIPMGKGFFDILI